MARSDAKVGSASRERRKIGIAERGFSPTAILRPTPVRGETLRRVLDIASAVFVRSGDALHLACAEEHGSSEVDTSDPPHAAGCALLSRDRGKPSSPTPVHVFRAGDCHFLHLCWPLVRFQAPFRPTAAVELVRMYSRRAMYVRIFP
jgi:hypothetical protein